MNINKLWRAQAHISQQDLYSPIEILLDRLTSELVIR